MNLHMYPVPHPQVAARVVDDSAVIVLADAGEVHVLNAVGTRIWELTDGTHTIQQIVDTIVAEFEVTPQQAQTDVEEFLQTLVDAQSLVLQEHPKRPQ